MKTPRKSHGPRCVSRGRSGDSSGQFDDRFEERFDEPFDDRFEDEFSDEFDEEYEEYPPRPSRENPKYRQNHSRRYAPESGRTAAIEEESFVPATVEPVRNSEGYPAPATSPAARESAGQLVGRAADNLQELHHRHYRGVRRFLKDDIGRVIADGEVQKAKEEVHTQIRTLRATREAQFQTIREELHTYVTAGKTAYRQQLGAWFADQHQHFETQLSKVERNFSAFIDRYQYDIDHTRHPLLRERKTQELKNKIERYYSIIGKVTREFDRVLEEGINKFTGQALYPDSEL